MNDFMLYLSIVIVVTVVVVVIIIITISSFVVSIFGFLQSHRF